MSATQIVNSVVPLVLAAIMLSMGLGLRITDFREVFKEPRVVVAGALAQLLLLPILGFACAFVFDLGPELSVGIVLLTACPGGATSNLFTNLARGDTALSVCLTAISGMVTIFTIPWMVKLASLVFASEADAISLPILRTMVEIFGIVGIPVAVGMFINHRWPHVARKLEGPVKAIAVLLLAVIIIGTVASKHERVFARTAQVGLAVLVLNIVAMALGYQLSRAMSLSVRRNVTIAIEVGVQNGGLAFFIGEALLGSIVVATPGMVYGLLIFITVTAFVTFARRRLIPA